MTRYHRSPNGDEFEQTLGDSAGQRSLAAYSPRGCKRDRHDLVPKEQQQNVIFTGALRKDHQDMRYLEGSGHVSFF